MCVRLGKIPRVREGDDLFRIFVGDSVGCLSDHGRCVLHLGNVFFAKLDADSVAIADKARER